MYGILLKRYFVFNIRVFWISVQGIKEGWYDGGSIAFAVILVIVVTGAIRCFLKFHLPCMSCVWQSVFFLVQLRCFSYLVIGYLSERGIQFTR